jgi:tetratricopeptide (TPR) repeat protein
VTSVAESRMRVFLSYARNDDEPFVKRLADALEAEGIHVWFDRRSMPSRSLTFLDEIRRAIDGVDRVIAVMGPAATASDYVRCEWQYALIRDKPVVPILRVGDYHLPPELRNLHCPDVRVSRPWRGALVEVLRVLNEPLPALGDVIGLPSLPPHFRPRPAALSRLAATVLLDQREPSNPERWQRVTVLSGMGGSGKSVLASALARSVEARRAFADGIYWLDTRRVPGREAGLEALAQLVALKTSSPVPAGPAEQKLSALLKDKRCLFVLDNVERIDQLESVLRCVDTTSRLLVTTRARDLVGEAHHVALSGLESSEARQQLADWLQLPPHAFDADCETILEMCEGLPFAIALCGSLIASGVSRGAVAAKLRSMDLSALQRRFPDYEFPGLLPCLEVSVEAVGRAHALAVACLERMVVFAPGAAIPEATVVLLWRTSLGMDEATCSFELARLCGHSLLRAEREQGVVSVHQLIHAYLSQRVPDRRAFHEELLTAYATISSADWVHGPDDGYYHAHLVYHLLAARGIDPVCDLLVGSPNWMREKLKVGGSALSYLVDVERALDALDDNVAHILPLARLAAARHLSRKGPRSFGDGVLKAMVRLGLAENALELARANVDPLTRIGQLLEIYETLREKGDVRTDLLDEVERFLTRSPESVFAEDIRVKLIPLFAGAGRLDDGLRLWRDLSARQREATRWLGQLLARRLADVGRIEEARSVDGGPSELAIDFSGSMNLDAAERAALATEDAMLRDVALAQLVSTLARRGLFERAQATARAIGRTDSRMIALAGIPCKPCLQEALETARTLDGFTRVLGVMQVAEMLHRLHELAPSASRRDRLRRWIRDRHRPGPQETSVELMAEAEQQIQVMDPVQRSISLRYMALLNHSRAVGESRRLLHAARASANEIDAPLRKAMELAEIAGDWARLDEKPETLATGRVLLEEAMALAEASSDPTATARAHTAVAHVLASHDRFDLALTLAEKIPDENERQRALDLIAAACADAGKPERVEILIARSSAQNEAGHQLAVALARAGRHDEAMNAALELHHEETLLQVARVLAEDGHARRALQLVDSLTDHENTAYQCVAVLARIARSDVEPTTIHRALERARTTADGIHSTTHKSMAYAELARTEAQLGDPAAEARFERAVELANAKDDTIFLTLLGPSPRFSALRLIGEQMSDAGFPEKTLGIVNSLENETDDEWQALCASLIAAVAARGERVGILDRKRTDELFSKALASARRAHNSMIGPPWQLIALLQVADQLAEAGRLRSAFDAISQAHFTVDPFVIGVSAWADSLDATAQGLSLSVIAAVAQVFGWQRSDWKAVGEEIAVALK